jgi:FlaA1/EpsC-like NDP-sugar epimerase
MRLSQLSPLLRRGIAYSHDIIMTALAIPLAYALRMGMDGQYEHLAALLLYTAFVTGSAFIIYPLIGLNRGAWRYASSRDMLAIIKGAFLVVLVSLGLSFLTTRLDDIPRTIPVIAFFILVVSLAGSRLAYRVLKDTAGMRSTNGLRSADKINVFLFGFSDHADTFIRAMQRSRKNRYRPIAIFDQRPKHKRRHLHGVPVLGQIESLPDAAKAMQDRGQKVTRLILTKPDISRKMMDMILQQASEAGLEVDRLPDMNHIEDVSLGQLPEPRALRLEDLLERPPIALDREGIGAMLTGRKILVTGAGGSIGSELCRQILEHRPQLLFMLDNNEYNLYELEQELTQKDRSPALQFALCDIRDREHITRLIAKNKLDVVFHAAALKHVPLVEHNPVEGIKTNIFGTRNVADATRLAGASAFVMISTDKAVNPTNMMGATKRVAEAYCQALDMTSSSTRFLTVRFGNVLGSRGSVVPLFEKQLREGGPLTVTHPDIKRYFMTIPEAVQLVMQASAYGLSQDHERGHIFVLDMGQPIKIADLARKVIQLAGMRPNEDIHIVYTGLRPGEKLFEELFDEKEPPQKTPAKGVLVAQPRTVNLELLSKSLEQLDLACNSMETERVLLLIRHMVPEFAPASAQTHSILALPAKDQTEKTVK